MENVDSEYISFSLFAFYKLDYNFPSKVIFQR